MTELPAICCEFDGILNIQENSCKYVAGIFKTIYGQNFSDGGVPTVYVNAESVDIISYIDTEITFRMPELYVGVHELVVVNGNANYKTIDNSITNYTPTLTDPSGTYVYPEWNRFYPRSGIIDHDSIELLYNTDKSGYVYVTATPPSFTSPTSLQVKNGTDENDTALYIGYVASSYVNADTNLYLTVEPMLPETDYYIWSVTENHALQSEPTLIERTTNGLQCGKNFIVYNTESGECGSKPTLTNVYDSDGINGDFGKIQTFYRNDDGEYIQVRLKYNSDFDVFTGGEATLGGIEVLDGDLVYLANQTEAAENGIYIVRAGSWEYHRFINDDLFIDLGARSTDTVDGDLTREIVTYNPCFTTAYVGFDSINYYSVNDSGVLSTSLRKSRIMERGASLVPTNSFKITQYYIKTEASADVLGCNTCC